MSRGRAKAEGKETMFSARASLGLLLGIFLASAGLVSLVWLAFPELEAEERPKLRLPRNVDQARDLGLLLSKYRQEHFPVVLAGVFVVYIFLQSFAIPGSIFLSILSGYLFPFPLALGLVCTCSAVGATICYLLSALVGRGIVTKYCPDKVASWSVEVGKQRENLLYYVMFLRITPFLPNWFINLASPVVEVPLTPFFLGTFLGVAPPSVFFVQAGTTLEEMTSSSSTFSWWSVGVLAACALLSLAPVALKARLKSKLQ